MEIKNLKQEQKERIIRTIIARKNFAQSYVNSRKAEWDLLWQYYNCYKKKEPYKSNIFVPLFFEFVETVAPMIYKSLTAVNPMITVLPTEERDIEPAMNMEKLINLQLTMREVSFKEKLLGAIKDTLIFGTHFIKVVPKVEDGFVIPVIDNTDVYDLYPHPRAKTIHDAYYIIAKYIKPLNEIIKNYKLTKEEIEEIKQSGGEIRYDRWSFYPHEEKDPTMLEPVLYEYYGYLRIDEEEDAPEVPCIATIVNDKVLIRLERNPYGYNFKPFIRIVDTPSTNSFYGLGLLKTIVPLQEEINTRRNQRSDNINKVINNMWKVLRGQSVDITQLVSRPDGIIFMDTPDAVTPHTIPDVTYNVIGEVQMARNDAVQATGIFPYIQGQAPIRQETAAGIITLQQAAGVRFSVKVDLINDMCLSELGSILGMYNIMHFKRATLREILGPNSYKFFELSRKDIMPTRNFDFRATGSAEEGIENPQLRRLNYLKLFNILLALPTELEDLLPTGERVKYRINHYQAIRRLLDVFDEKLTEKILTREQTMQLTPEQIAQIQQLLTAQTPAEETLAAEEELTDEELQSAVAQPVTGVVPKQQLRPEDVSTESLAKMISARVTR